MTDSSEEEEEIERERSELLGERHSGSANHSSSVDRPSVAAPGKRRGRLLKMPFSKNKSVWFVWDPCGIICAVMTYMLIFYGELVLLIVVAPPFPDIWTVLNGLVFTGLVGLSVVAHVKAMITDPVREEEEEEKGMRGRGITKGGGGGGGGGGGTAARELQRERESRRRLWCVGSRGLALQLFTKDVVA